MGIAVQRPLRRMIVSDIRAACLLATLFGFASVVLAEPVAGQVRPPTAASSPDTHSGLWHKNALGGQLGPWFSSNLSAGFSDPNVHLTTTSTAFHMELFYQPHLAGMANLDLNVGAVGRGEIKISTATETSYGSATIYPIGLGVRLAPFAGSTQWAVQPILRLGGTVLIGTEQYQGVLSGPAGTFIGTSTQSRWALGFYGGAGLAWLLGDRIALTASVKYQYARFGKEVFGSTDYSGIQVLVGVMYLYFSEARRGFNR